MDEEPNPIPADTVQLTLSVRDWTFIDATIDNTASIAAQEGDETTAQHGLAIREAGWSAARQHPRNGQGPADWPPEDDELTIELPAASWQFAAEQLRRWDDVDALVNPRGGIGSPDF